MSQEFRQMLIVIVRKRKNCKNVNYSHFGSPIIDQYSTRSKKISTHFKKKKRVWDITLNTLAAAFCGVSLNHLRRCWFREIFHSFRYVFRFLGKEFLKETSRMPQWVFNRWVRKVTRKAVSALRDVWVVIEPIEVNCVTVRLQKLYSNYHVIKNIRPWDKLKNFPPRISEQLKRFQARNKTLAF